MSEANKTQAPVEARQDFRKFILKNNHPCLMAQAVAKQGHYMIKEYGELGSADNVPTLLSDLQAYLEKRNSEEKDFYTFIAFFGGPKDFSEKEFEDRLWKQLAGLHRQDPEPWDPEVSADPDSSNFSFSLLGRAFYIVGMHPGSSRKARQMPRPALVFNLHSQFERLREIGAYKTTQEKIRERDKALQGHINPMLSDFGQGREAAQYSGRQVGRQWKCPFHPDKNQIS